MNNIELLKVIATQNNFYSNANSVIDALPNPDKILGHNERKYSVYEDLLNDGHVWSVTQSRKSKLLSMLWEINRGANKSEIALFIEDVFKDLDIRGIIEDILDAPLYGWQPMEVLWQNKDGHILPVEITAKPHEWFYFDTNNMLRFRKNGSTEGELVPHRKFFTVQHKPKYMNPYGVAILSKCFWPVFYKKEEVKFWAVYTEKFGSPFIVGKTETGTPLKEKELLAEQLDNLRQDGIAIVDSDNDITSLDLTGANSQDIYNKLIVFCNAEISKAVLSQTLTTEQGDTGSYAMSQTHLEVRDDVVKSDRTMVEYWLNKLIQWIVELNFGEMQELPKFIMYEEKEVDLTLAQRDQALTSSGQIRFTKPYYQRNYGLKDDEFEIVEAQPAQPLFAEDDDLPNDQIGMDRTSAIGVSSLADDVESILMNDIVKRIESGNSIEEVYKAIIDSYDDIDMSDIEEKIAHGILIANVGGQIAGSM